MKIVCKSCGSTDVIVKDKKGYCECCGLEFNIDELKPAISPTTKPVCSNKFEKFFNGVVAIVAKIDETVSRGTAFFVSPQFAITNAHVILAKGDCAELIVGKNYEGDQNYNFEVVSFDEDLDIALLKLTSGRHSVYSRFNPIVHNGQSAYAVGNTQGEGLCILNGIVSDKNREYKNISYIMCSNIVGSGNSGGPLFDENGKVIGMITMASTETVSMTYALPAKTINEFLSKVINKKGVDL